MKVKCVNTFGYEKLITVGEIYEAVSSGYVEFYSIEKDGSCLGWILQNKFINWDKGYRSERLKILLDES